MSSPEGTHTRAGSAGAAPGASAGDVKVNALVDGVECTAPQPSASIIVNSRQWILVGSQPTDHRGRVTIRASSQWDAEVDQAEHEWHGFSDSFCGLCRYEDVLGLTTVVAGLPLDAPVGSADLVDCVPITNTTPVPHEPHLYVRHDGAAWLWQTASGPGLLEHPLLYGDLRPGRWALLFENGTSGPDGLPPGSASPG